MLQAQWVLTLGLLLALAAGHCQLHRCNLLERLPEVYVLELSGTFPEVYVLRTIASSGTAQGSVALLLGALGCRVTGGLLQQIGLHALAKERRLVRASFVGFWKALALPDLSFCVQIFGLLLAPCSVRFWLAAGSSSRWLTALCVCGFAYCCAVLTATSSGFALSSVAPETEAGVLQGKLQLNTYTKLRATMREAGRSGFLNSVKAGP